MKKILIGLVLTSGLILGACDSKEVSDESTDNKVSKEVIKNKKQVNEGLENYKGLKIGDTVSVKYADVYKDKYAYDFTLNKLEFTDQVLGGKEPKYESGFIIAYVTIKNTGNDKLGLDIFDNVTYGSAIFSYGKKYGFQGLDESTELAVGDTVVGKMVVRFSKIDNTITNGLEGTSTVFSYDIKADEIGDYVPE
ncbi:hypothetical protein [Carnobacterium divergens]|uniref:hypothetical protein n=1 Tax=Carnobacterium divergens TaxID=2748 RepID=UPI0010721413|nr:hypothetical protein [Carnobacterium divergens]TFI73696.1 hypothetical protein CKN81_05425 [Carnobacterium divergens]